MASKEVADLTHAEDWTGVEIHVVHGVVRDGAGNVTNHGSSRRITLAELEAKILADAPAAPTRLRPISFFFVGNAVTANEVLGVYVAVDAFTFAADFAGSHVGVIANPTASFAIAVSRQVNGAGAFGAIGTITISTLGVVTFVTTGDAAVAIAAGDVIKFTAPAGGDATAQATVTVKGTI